MTPAAGTAHLQARPHPLVPGVVMTDAAAEDHEAQSPHVSQRVLWVKKIPNYEDYHHNRTLTGEGGHKCDHNHFTNFPKQLDLERFLFAPKCSPWPDAPGMMILNGGSSGSSSNNPSPVYHNSPTSCGFTDG